MNTLDVAHEVTTRGFTVVPDALDPEAVDCLTGVLDRLVHEDLAHPDPRRRDDDWMAFNGVLRDDAIADVVTHAEHPSARRGDPRAHVHHVRVRELEHAAQRHELSRSAYTSTARA